MIFIATCSMRSGNGRSWWNLYIMWKGILQLNLWSTVLCSLWIRKEYIIYGEREWSFMLYEHYTWKSILLTSVFMSLSMYRIETSNFIFAFYMQFVIWETDIMPQMIPVLSAFPVSTVMNWVTQNVNSALTTIQTRIALTKAQGLHLLVVQYFFSYFIYI